MSKLDYERAMFLAQFGPQLPDLSTAIASGEFKSLERSFCHYLFPGFHRHLHIHDLQQFLPVGFAHLRQPIGWVFLGSLHLVQIENFIGLNGLKHWASPISLKLPALAGSAPGPARVWRDRS